MRERATMGLKQKKFNYFDAFEQQVNLACEEAKLLIHVIEHFETSEGLLPYINKAHDIEHEGDGVCHDVYGAVSTDFVTPIEREDIIALTQSLDNILDYMEATVQRFYMLNVDVMHERAADFARMLLKSCEALKVAMEDFRNFKNSKKLKQLIVEVGDVEEEADRLFFDVIHELFSGKYDPHYVVVWDKLFQRMEDCADACERVADLMDSIMLKNS